MWRGGVLSAQFLENIKEAFDEDPVYQTYY